MFSLLSLLLATACLYQVVFSQCVGSPAVVPVGAGYGLGEMPLGPTTSFGSWSGSGLCAYNSIGTYGGIGAGDVAVAGEMPVAGNTVVVGQVPVLGNVRFGGEIPAGGIISVSGSCSCGLNGVILN